MSQPLRISVAIYDKDDDGSIFKHWALAIEAPEDPHKTMLLQVMGSDGRFRYEPATADVRARPGLIQQVYLTDAAAARLNSIRDVADRVPVCNEIRGWNCQDFVLDLLDALEEEQVVDGVDEGYRLRRLGLQGMQEGLA